MARSDGPFGPPGGRAPLRRDSLSSLQPPRASHAPAQVPWPTQGYADQGHQPAQAGPAYHFPPPDPDPSYGYNQPVYAPQQWSQPDQRGYDLANYLPNDPPPFQNTAHQQHAYADADPDYGDEYYEDEEPRRSRRWMFIAAALIGAIGVGGALAYTYRSFVAPRDRVPPLVKNESVKVSPRKETAGNDRKLPSRADTGSLTPPPVTEEKNEAAADQGPRKVPTIAFGPQQKKKAAPPPVVSSVPGISLDNAGPPPKDPPADRPPAEPPPAEPPPADERAVVVPPPPPEPKADKGDEEPPPQPERKIASLTPPPPPPISNRRPPSSGLGFVAVVSSQKTHMDAFKAFVDAAEKHPDVLGGKTPDVQMADLGEKGVWYRAVVGPPVSREAAMAICTQLKAAGHGCWVKEY